MTEAAAILEVRHVRLAEQATLQPAALGEDGEEGVFVALDDPPPVRTVLTVVEGERRRALEVAWVVEVAERDATRGFYGRWVGDEALERAAKVGTEHLEDGTPVVQPVVPDHSASMDVSDAAMMAMPAPVMIVDDDTGVVDVGDHESDGDRDEPGHGEDGDEAGDEAGSVGDEAGSVDDEGAQAADAPVQTATEQVETAVEQVETAVEQVETAVEQVETAADHVETEPEASDAEADEAETEAGATEAETEADAGADEAEQAPAATSEGDDGSRSRGGRKKRSRRRR